MGDVSHRYVYLCDFLFHVAFAMNIMLVPLYAQTFGLSPLVFGAVIALPSILMVLMSMGVGVVADRLGEKPMLLVCFGSAVLSGLVLAGAPLFAALLVAQLLMGIARMIFWVATISYVTRIPGSGQARRLSLINGFQHAGMLLGFIAAGLVLTEHGFPAAFGVFAFGGALAFSAALALAPLPRPELQRQKGLGGVLQQLVTVARKRPMYLSGIAALLAAIPLGLLASFYPVQMLARGFDPSTIGVVNGFHNLGFLAMSLVLALFVRTGLPRVSLTASLIVMGGALYAFGRAPTPTEAAAAVFVAAAASNVVTLTYQHLVGRHCSEAERGVGSAFANEFFASGLILAPIVFGYLTQVRSLTFAFEATAVAAVVVGLVLYPAAAWFLRPIPPRDRF